MRILYIHQYFSTPRGAAGIRSYEQARLMVEAGHDVTMLISASMLCPDEVPPGKGMLRRGKVAGLNCIVLDVPYHQTMSYARRIMAFLTFMFRCCWLVLTEPRIDCVYATSTPLTVGIPALGGKLVRAIPYVFEVRDLWPDVPLGMGILKPGIVSRVLKVAERMIYRHARVLVAVNADVGKRMLQTVGRAKPLVVAPNACDTYLFNPDRDGANWRTQHGLVDKIVCMHSGTMGRVNGLEMVLDAAAALAGDDRLRFVLIGEGKERPNLQKRVADEGLSNVLILERVSKTELADVLAVSDIGLMTVQAIPILQLNCANKFFDYLASGLPIVLNYQWWQADVLAEYEAGLAAPQGDTDTFVAHIRRLTDDAALRQRLGANARQLAETGLNRKTVVQPILDALAGLERGR